MAQDVLSRHSGSTCSCACMWHLFACGESVGVGIVISHDLHAGAVPWCTHAAAALQAVPMMPSEEACNTAASGMMHHGFQPMHYSTSRALWTALAKHSSCRNICYSRAGTTGLRVPLTRQTDPDGSSMLRSLLLSPLEDRRGLQLLCECK